MEGRRAITTVFSRPLGGIQGANVPRSGETAAGSTAERICGALAALLRSPAWCSQQPVRRRLCGRAWRTACADLIASSMVARRNAKRMMAMALNMLLANRQVLCRRPSDGPRVGFCGKRWRRRRRPCWLRMRMRRRPEEKPVPRSPAPAGASDTAGRSLLGALVRGEWAGDGLDNGELSALRSAMMAASRAAGCVQRRR